MKAGLFAMFTRSLQEESRRLSTYIARGVLVALILVLFFFAAQQARMSAGAQGLLVFGVIANINLVFLSLIGVAFFSSAITEEKEEQTLGLLRMANLNALSILLGKSVSRWLGVAMLILIQFPFTILSVSLGGIAVKQVMSVYAVILTYSFFLSNLCLFFSVRCRTTARAASWSTVVLLCVLFLFSWIAAFFNATANTSFGFSYLAAIVRPLGPFMDVIGILRPAARVVAGDVLFHHSVRLVVGCALFLLSWLFFERTQREDVGGEVDRVAGSPKIAKVKARKGGPVSLPWASVVAWKDFYFHAGGTFRLMLSALFMVTISFLFSMYAYVMSMRFSGFQRNIPWGEVIGYPLFFVGIISFAIGFALTMSRAFHQEIREKTWSSLAMLPMSMYKLTHQKVLAAFISMTPALGVALVGALLSMDSWGRDFTRNNAPLYFVCYLVTAYTLTVFVITFFSIFLRWGAFVLGIAITGLFLFVSVLFVSSAMREAEGLLMLSFFNLIGVAVLYPMIIRRLERRAAED